VKATVRQLRSATRQILGAVARGEMVVVTYRGKPFARMIPADDYPTPGTQDALFGIWKDNPAATAVDAYVRRLRKGARGMIVDTDVIVWFMRGNDKARQALGVLPVFAISAVTYMELVQGLRNGEELRELKRFLHSRRVECIALDPEISARAIAFMERYCLGHGLHMADALIAATVDIRGETLLTANAAHYRMIPGVALERFRSD